MILLPNPTGILEEMTMASPAPYRIRRKRWETKDTCTLILRAESETKEFVFAPGQFNMLYLFGVGEVPISFSGDPEARDIVEHTIRDQGSVTRVMCRLRVGDSIGVRGPYGTGWPMQQARGKSVILMAGGLGLAPLRPVLLSLLAHRDEYAHIVILYGSRTPQDLLYTKQLQRWRSRLDIEVAVTVDRAGGDWRGNVGVITTLKPATAFDPSRTVAFLCGPEIMMRYGARALEERGLPPDQIYLSMERNMKCAVGHCGRCQYGPKFICKDGPVFSYRDIAWLLNQREI